MEDNHFTLGYAAAMLWANAWVETETEIVSIADWDGTATISEDSLEQMRSECHDFLSMWLDGPNTSVLALLYRVCDDTSTAYSWSDAGHDFALTRNGHGAGYWDRGLGTIGDLLTEAAKTYGESSLNVNPTTSVATLVG